LKGSIKVLIFKFFVLFFLILLSFQIDGKTPTQEELQGIVFLIVVILLFDYLIEKA